MPTAIRALADSGPLQAYRERPPYQRNDYLGWTAQANRPEREARRLAQMLRELGQGHGYMNMACRPRRV